MSDSMRPKADDYVPPCMNFDNPGPHVASQVRCGGCGRLEIIPEEKRSAVGSVLGFAHWQKAEPNSVRKDEIAKLRQHICDDCVLTPREESEIAGWNAAIDAVLKALTLLRGRASKVVTEFATCDGTRPAFDPPVWLMQAADAFAGGHISTGKLAELLGASDIHAFKVAAGAFVETPIEHYANRYEYVHHLPDCPSIGGYGDEACRCGAVAFLKSLDTFEERTPSGEGWQQRIAAMEPWEDVGFDSEEQACFFCGNSRFVVEHPSGGHATNCLWQNAVDATPPASGGEGASKP